MYIINNKHNKEKLLKKAINCYLIKFNLKGFVK